MLHLVAAGVTRGGRGSDFAAGITRTHARFACGLGGFLDQAIDEEPRAVVLRLFLAPDDLLEIGHAFETHGQRFAGEGVELLDPDDRDVFKLCLVAALPPIVVLPDTKGKGLPDVLPEMDYELFYEYLGGDDDLGGEDEGMEVELAEVGAPPWRSEDAHE